MKVYFVRHGETMGNAQKIHNHADMELSETGREQAQTVAKRFKSIDFDVILASDYSRAKETAEAIQHETGKKLEFSELARERTLPHEIQNKAHDDPSIQDAIKTILGNIRDPKYHYSNEENFFDMKDRSRKLVEFIAGRSEKNLVVVLHGTILRFVMATMMYGDDYDWDTFCGLFKFHIDNTGITVCELTKNEWRIITWNDSLHLGEI